MKGEEEIKVAFVEGKQVFRNNSISRKNLVQSRILTRPGKDSQKSSRTETPEILSPPSRIRLSSLLSSLMQSFHWFSPAGAGIHRHAGVNLQHHIPAGVQEEDAEGTHLVGNAARLGNTGDDPHRSHDALDGGVVRRTHHLRKQVG